VSKIIGPVFFADTDSVTLNWS